MAKQKITGLSASLLEQPQTAAPLAAFPTAGTQPDEILARSKPVVQTVKVPPDVYIRLKTMGARERRSSQDIILTAVREYLSRSG
jgi:hypothetical protein